MMIRIGWAVFFILTLWNAGVAEQKPNVLMILADDLGWSDTTLYGTTTFYQTPNIARLAERGMTFTRAYSASPLCSPTRASLLTGLSPARHGITSPNCHLPTVTLQASAGPSGPPNQKTTRLTSVSRLDTKYFTLAEMFKGAGYATGHFGKWHLGAEPYSPLQHGFDVDVPHHPGPGPAGSYVAPWKFKDFDHDPDVPDQHIEDRMASEAVAFLEQNRNEPFFLNYWMFSVHAPFDAKAERIEQYRKRVDPKNPQRSPTYAAMIDSMDDAVGTLLDALDRFGLAENTIIVFASDNGGNMYNEVDGTTATSNAPLRGGKATMYEGGVRGPAIVVYPGRVQPASRSDELIQSCDFYPTLLDLLGRKPRPGQVFDGTSIVPALNGDPIPREAIFTFFPHSPPIPEWLPASVSAHAGDWKLIRLFHAGDNGDHRYKLFDLKNDVGESNDLAGEMPDKVRELDRLIGQFLEDTDAVVPGPNPKFDPARYDPSLEGQGKLKRSGVKAPPAKTRSQAPAVAGWRPAGTCKLQLQGDTLVVISDGGDPHLSYSFTEAFGSESFVLKFTLQSDSRGLGQIFWQEQGVRPAFHRDRSKPFEVRHDGNDHEYSISWTPSKPIQAVRIDPSTGPGRVQLSNVRLINGEGEQVYQWDFRSHDVKKSKR